jgi:hypothetical protein
MNDVAKPRSTLSVPRLGRCRLARGKNAPSLTEKDDIVECLALLTHEIRPMLTARCKLTGL